MPSLLKSSLAQLDDVAPSDDLPRVRGDVSDEEDDNSSQDEAEGVNRDHYQPTASSSRRRKANLTEEGQQTLNSGKYAGRVTRLADLESGRDDDDEELDSEEDSEESSGEEDEEEEDSEDDDEDMEPPIGSLKPGKRSVRFDEAAEKPNDPSSSLAPRTMADSLGQQSELLSSLRSQAREDAARGQAVKEQMALWQKALENRIKMDKILGNRGIGRVEPSAMPALLSASEEPIQTAHCDLTENLLDHSAALLETQSKLLELSDVDVSSLQSELALIGKKRKRSEEDDLEQRQEALEAAHRQQLSFTLQFHSNLLQPFTSSVLRQQGGSRGGSGDLNKFSGGSSGLKAFDQSIDKQVAAAMEGENGQKLVERTRKFRGQSRRIGARSDEAAGNIDSTTSTALSDGETFDDSDYYAALLRSLIESSSTPSTSSNTLDGSSPTPLRFHPRTNTKSKGIDTRASKGRKLRFEVLEKVANFMPRIGNREKWTEEMRERLYDILPGKGKVGKGGKRDEEDLEGLMDDDDDDDVAPVDKAKGEEAQDLGGLRLFG